MDLRIHLLSLLAGALLIAGQSGCAFKESMANIWHDTKRIATPEASDRRDLTEDPAEDWSFVGEEGRAGQTAERVDDEWYRNLIMSEKARQIEENLGYK